MKLSPHGARVVPTVAVAMSTASRVSGMVGSAELVGSPISHLPDDAAVGSSHVLTDFTAQDQHQRNLAPGLSSR